jgi:hypothetical protein
MRWVWHEERCNRGLERKPEGKRPIGRPRPRRSVILDWMFKKYDGWLWTGLVWLRKGTADGHTDTTIWFHKMRGISGMTEELLASQE